MIYCNRQTCWGISPGHHLHYLHPGYHSRSKFAREQEVDPQYAGFGLTGIANITGCTNNMHIFFGKITSRKTNESDHQDKQQKLWPNLDKTVINQRIR